MNFQHNMKAFTRKYKVKRLLALALFVGVCSGAWAQQTENHYTDTYGGTNISGVSIQHKPAKWYSFRRSGADYNDSFDENNSMTSTLNGLPIQATNTYVDTIYMHKGTSINIDIPQTNNNTGTDSSNKGYNLWYDFRTGGTLFCDYQSSSLGHIYDLLTLQETQSGTYFYRFANGYAGGLNLTNSNRRLQHMTFYYPTDEEFEAMKANNSSFQAIDNDYYILACDVSLYNDCAKEYIYGGATFGASNGWYEPTLTGRDIYYIVGVEDEGSHIPGDFAHYWALASASYQGGGNEIDTDGNYIKNYLEEYEITFPARHFSNHTYELVTLTKDAQAYAIPGEKENSDIPLTVTLAENDNPNDLLLAEDNESLGTVTNTISGANRVIQFYKDNGNNKKPWKVDDGSTATILVTKEVNGTIYNIARYKLTFKEESSPLTQTQVDRLDKIADRETVNGEYWWDNLSERSSIYMKNNYRLLTSLKFDYGDSGNAANVFTGGKDEFYAFPLAWDNCGYAFYDGCANDDVNSGQSSYSINGTTSYTQWGMYSIVDKYIGYGTGSYVSPPSNTGKDDTGYWMYIDASDRPGAIAELTFDEKLCQGSKLYVSGWLKGESSNNDGAVLLTIMGVTKGVDASGNSIETHTPIHRHCSGQIRLTNQLNNSAQPDEPTPPSDITGKGNGHNEWWQFYFTFVNSGNMDYDYYTLKVENYCASSTGGDFDIDDVDVYVLHPTVKVVQIEPICTDNNDKTLMRVDLEYEAIMSRLGYEVTEYENSESDASASIDFIVINKTKYNNYLAAISGDVTENDKMLAIQSSIVTFWDSDEYVQNEGGMQYPTIDFYLNYEKNTAYDSNNIGGNVSSKNDGYFYFRETETGVRELSVDCYTDMSAYTEYIILLEPHNDAYKTDSEKALEFASTIDDNCAIRSDFYLTSTTILKINGEVADPTQDFCAGQTMVLSPDVTYINDSGDTQILSGVYFDWFFGTKEEYIAENDEFNNVSLRDALLAFRNAYPEAEELSESETPADEDKGFKQDYFDIIAYYLQQTRTDATTEKLILYKTHLDISITEVGLELVIQPIQVYVTDSNGEPVEICFGYVPLTLQSSGGAPNLRAGFSNIVYPDDDFMPCLRLGLDQLSRTSQSNVIIVNLCGASYVKEDGIDVDHLGIAAADGLDLLYLVNTNDPAYHEFDLDNPDFDQYSLPVGKIVHLYATPDNKSDDEGIKGSYMKIYFYKEDSSNDWEFYKKFEAKEGYYYVVSVHYEEKSSTNGALGNACQGTFPLEVKIVPEYLVWQGGNTDNWNNDNHWRRADKSDLNKPDNDPYITNAENGSSNGYVPMLFTKVVIPKNSAAELYMAGFVADKDGTGATTEMLVWEGDEESATHDDVAEHPTSNIMYDLMLYENPTSGALKTEHYRVNLCDEIHLAPGAQVLHSEQLIYNKAWTEVQLPQGPWTLQATPLRDVVSGDWYTKRATGTETAEYFKDITWSDTDNYRYTPLLYQRSWGTSDKVILNNYTGTGASTTVPSYASTGWSSVYNDTSVPYQAGEGFSIKGNLDSGADLTLVTDSLMFRFPKADTEYTLSSAESGTKFDRTNANRLLISDLVTRTDPDGDAPDSENNKGVYTGNGVTVTLTQTGNGYYIIGNPFTAPMSMSKFMAGNTSFVGYWTESTYGPIAGNGKYSSWGTNDVLIEPYHAFFVTTKESDITPLATDPVTVAFTKDMQGTETTTQDESSSTTSLVAFSVRAEGKVGTTGAALVYDDRAEDGYNVVEDVILMEDDAWSDDGMPVVYTVAGDMAVSVNWVNSMELVPMGVYADDDCVYTLTFVGTDKLNEPSLYDAYTNTDTPLTEGYSLSMTGATHGRYFIRSKGAATDISQVVNEEYSLSAYSPVERTVVVSSTAEIESVEVYSMSGVLQKKVGVGNSLACTIEGVSSGIAIVRAHTTESTFVKKIMVK